MQWKSMLEANILHLETEGVTTTLGLASNRSAWLSSIICLNGLGWVMSNQARQHRAMVWDFAKASSFRPSAQNNSPFLSVKLWLRFATSWLAVLIVGFTISFYVLPYGLMWFVGLLY